ncbi:MAG: hypothetical protein AAGD00_04265 [Planctomycetota bacterium]
MKHQRQSVVIPQPGSSPAKVLAMLFAGPVRVPEAARRLKCEERAVRTAIDNLRAKGRHVENTARYQFELRATRAAA